MAHDNSKDQWIVLETDQPIWSHFFTIAPLVVVGSKEKNGYDLAPKHMAMPLGHGNYFGFMCTPRHATYHNIKHTGEFSVSFPQPSQIVLASLAASPRGSGPSCEKTIVGSLPTMPAKIVDAPLLADSYLLLECHLDRIIDGFGDFSLISGKIVYAEVHEEAQRISDRDDGEMIYQMPLLAYLPYDRFAEIRETQSFPFPKDFDKSLASKMKDDEG